MERMKAIFVAGGLTGLVLVTVLVLGLRSAGAANEGGVLGAVSAPAAPEEALGMNDTAAAPASVDAAQLRTLLGQNQQLRGAVETMQAREREYQRQIEAANRTIDQLQSQPVSQGAPTSYEEEHDDDDDEHEEHQWEGEHDDD